MFKNKKILITGGSGMIGRQVVDILLKKGADIYVASLDESPNLPKQVKYRETDLTVYSNCLSVCEGMDYVFNLVGIKASPKMCLERPADIMVPMLLFNTNMMEAARKSKVKWYLYTSTVGVYQPAELLKEDDVWNTFPSRNDWYGGWAKRIGELQAEAYKKQDGYGNISIVRPSNVYGPYDNFDLNNAMVIPSLIRKAHENDVLSVWGDGSAIRDFIHCRDVARGMVHMVENQVTEPVNLGSGKGASIKQVVETIVDNCSFDVKVEWDTSKPTGDKKRLFDASRAKSYGFLPEISIEDGIRETIKWYNENKYIIDKRYNVFHKGQLT